MILKLKAEGLLKRRYVSTRSHGVKFGIILHLRKYGSKLFMYLCCERYKPYSLRSENISACNKRTNERTNKQTGRVQTDAGDIPKRTHTINKQTNYANIRNSIHGRISDAELHRGRYNAVDCSGATDATLQLRQCHYKPKNQQNREYGFRLPS